MGNCKSPDWTLGANKKEFNMPNKAFKKQIFYLLKGEIQIKNASSTCFNNMR